MKQKLPVVEMRRRKTILFACTIVLSFFSSMSKVLVPNAIFDQLQNELGLNVAVLSRLAGWYMYAYAASQLGCALLADCLGGVRILLFATLTFTGGTLLFPLCSSPSVLLLLRILTGLGAGCVFIALLQLVEDLYSDHFGYVLGFSLFLGYLGPSVGSGPMVWLVQLYGWRIAMMVPALFALALTMVMLPFMRGVMEPVAKRPAVLVPLKEAMLQGNMLRICLASSLAFGIYYTLLNLMGRKCLEDAMQFPVRWSSSLLMFLTFIAAGLNFLAGFICSLFKGRYRRLMIGLSLFEIAGVSLGWLSLRFHWTGVLMALSYILISIPAGCFSIYANMTKEDSPPKYVSLKVTLVNFWAFVMIAIMGNLGGSVMHSHEAQAEQIDGILRYPLAAYQGIFLLFLALSFVILASTWGLFRKGDGGGARRA